MMKICLEEVRVVGDGQTYIPQHNIFLFYNVDIMWVLFCLPWDTVSYISLHSSLYCCTHEQISQLSVCTPC